MFDVDISPIKWMITKVNDEHLDTVIKHPTQCDFENSDVQVERIIQELELDPDAVKQST